jgi:hypothetical protein
MRADGTVHDKQQKSKIYIIKKHFNHKKQKTMQNLVSQSLKKRQQEERLTPEERQEQLTKQFKKNGGDGALRAIGRKQQHSLQIALQQLMDEVMRRKQACETLYKSLIGPLPDEPEQAEEMGQKMEENEEKEESKEETPPQKKDDEEEEEEGEEIAKSKARSDRSHVMHVTEAPTKNYINAFTIMKDVVAWMYTTVYAPVKRDMKPDVIAAIWMQFVMDSGNMQDLAKQLQRFRSMNALIKRMLNSHRALSEMRMSKSDAKQMKILVQSTVGTFDVDVILGIVRLHIVEPLRLQYSRLPDSVETVEHLPSRADVTMMNNNIGLLMTILSESPTNVLDCPSCRCHEVVASDGGIQIRCKCGGTATTESFSSNTDAVPECTREHTHHTNKNEKSTEKKEQATAGKRKKEEEDLDY